MHVNQNSFNRQQYRTRALSASPSPPPIPKQPDRYQFNEQIVPYEIPEPPPRRYQLVPIRDEQSVIGSTQQNLSSFGRSSYDRNNLRQNDYENTRDIIRPPIVKDPRRKPYYYNELSQNLDVNDNNIAIPNSNLELFNSNNENQVTDVTIRNSAVTMGSGGSLDHII